MTSYIMYVILKPSVFWKIWQRGPITSFLGGRWASDGLDPALRPGAEQFYFFFRSRSTLKNWNVAVAGIN